MVSKLGQQNFLDLSLLSSSFSSSSFFIYFLDEKEFRR